MNLTIDYVGTDPSGEAEYGVYDRDNDMRLVDLGDLDSMIDAASALDKRFTVGETVAMLVDLLVELPYCGFVTTEHRIQPPLNP